MVITISQALEEIKDCEALAKTPDPDEEVLRSIVSSTCKRLKMTVLPTQSQSAQIFQALHAASLPDWAKREMKKAVDDLVLGNVPAASQDGQGVANKEQTLAKLYNYMTETDYKKFEDNVLSTIASRIASLGIYYLDENTKKAAVTMYAHYYEQKSGKVLSAQELYKLAVEFKDTFNRYKNRSKYSSIVLYPDKPSQLPTWLQEQAYSDSEPPVERDVPQWYDIWRRVYVRSTASVLRGTSQTGVVPKASVAHWPRTSTAVSLAVDPAAGGGLNLLHMLAQLSGAIPNAQTLRLDNGGSLTINPAASHDLHTSGSEVGFGDLRGLRRSPSPSDSGSRRSPSPMEARLAAGAFSRGGHAGAAPGADAGAAPGADAAPALVPPAEEPVQADIAPSEISGPATAVDYEELAYQQLSKKPACKKPASAKASSSKPGAILKCKPAAAPLKVSGKKIKAAVPGPAKLWKVQWDPHFNKGKRDWTSYHYRMGFKTAQEKGLSEDLCKSHARAAYADAVSCWKSHNE